MIIGYTADNICELYRRGKDDPQIVQKLADLALCSTDEIYDILHEHGYYIKRCNCPHGNWIAARERWKLAHKLYIQGLPVAEILCKTGITAQSWRARNRRFKNYGLEVDKNVLQHTGKKRKQ